MNSQGRTVQHLSLHRSAGVELRVVADIEEGVLPIIEAEDTVLRGYAGTAGSPLTSVTLFILADLQPLARQLRAQVATLPDGLEPGDLDSRPILNVYDLANPTACHVFVNRQALLAAGYWGDRVAVRGLLAHEHAHPLSENATTRASRQITLQVTPQLADTVCGPLQSDARSDLELRMQRVLAALARKLCLDAPRELFANQQVIAGGFGDDLFHLDQRTVQAACQAVTGREGLRQQLQAEMARGALTALGVELLLLVGDLQGYLDLALETASFYRSDGQRQAHELESALETCVFPHLDPQAPLAYRALRDPYLALPANLAPSELIAWGDSVLVILAQAVAEKGMALRHHLAMAEEHDGGTTHA
jgi:hypothetical protein